ncbi:acetylglutamate kinase, chloroplastic-like [Dioscorea cayenensis subsp. rotundata]|uniref:Acetylglutamate kinase, chloroplastic-like n=1 Tax=Dioscorea cayennensis subsp. rotundata TaxID=55577 RepID=A0AB40CUU7_DIOCR|nr:acetylglutamate kinase, chloroplastic-like [Dioscorea cayenensis subsp. rotundata]
MYNDESSIILVHGGGSEINAWLLRTDHEPKFDNGLRVTNAHSMEVVDMVFAGKINRSLVAEINMLGGTDVGLGGKDARLLNYSKALLGSVELENQISLQLINLQQGLLVGLRVLTDIAGIIEDRNDPGSLVKEIDIAGIRKMMEKGKVVGGIIQKGAALVASRESHRRGAETKIIA